MKSYTVINTILGLYKQLVDTRYSKNADVFQDKDTYEVKKGILFRVHVSSECFGYEKGGNTHHEEWRGYERRVVHCLLLANHSVFMHESGASDPMFDIPQSGWVNTSNHDSCWRSGLDNLKDIGFKVVESAWKDCPKEHWKEDLDSMVDFRIGFVLFNAPMFKLVEVDYIPDYDLDISGYHKKITAVRELPDTQLTI